MAEIPPEVLRAVVETMRYVADDPKNVWAGQVEQYAANKSFCCPMCAEFKCDEDCPLRHYR